MATNSTTNSANSTPIWVLRTAAEHELAEGSVWPGRHNSGVLFEALRALWRRKAIAAAGMALGALAVGGLILLEKARKSGDLFNESDGATQESVSNGDPSLAQKIAGVLSGLRRPFPTVLLIMPATSTGAWKHYAEAGLVDTDLLVIRPQSANRRRAQLGMKLVGEADLQMVGCLVDIGRDEQVSLRLSQLAPSQAAAPAELEL